MRRTSETPQPRAQRWNPSAGLGLANSTNDVTLASALAARPGESLSCDSDTIERAATPKTEYRWR